MAPPGAVYDTRLMKLEEIVSYLDHLLRIAEFDDYPHALNGLQLQNSGRVTKVAVAVDACEPVLEMTVAAGADLLVVHHGLLWGGLQTFTGPFYRKLKLAMANDLAIYSAHLPLDAHSRHGNNALLCDALGLPEPRRSFLQIGFRVDVQIERDLLRENLERAVGGKVHLAPGGPTVSRSVGVVTGAAGGEVAKAAEEGVDTFVTGEGPHWSFTAAEELGINLFYAGHYATEVFGVQELGRLLEARFELPWEFLDHPTGL
jgi:dinuclear metal center YbgI/SA1388 family protein